jgi:hypothetical protein
MKMKLKEIIKSYENVNLFLTDLRNKIYVLIEQNPDFVYVYRTEKEGHCNYNGPATDEQGKNVGPDCSGCLIGQALQSMGWNDPEELNFFGSVFELIRDIGSVNLAPSNSILQDIRSTQRKQDRGYPWKMCVYAD